MLDMYMHTKGKNKPSNKVDALCRKKNVLLCIICGQFSRCPKNCCYCLYVHLYKDGCNLLKGQKLLIWKRLAVKYSVNLSLNQDCAGPLFSCTRLVYLFMSVYPTPDGAISLCVGSYSHLVSRPLLRFCIIIHVTCNIKINTYQRANLVFLCFMSTRYISVQQG